MIRSGGSNVQPEQRTERPELINGSSVSVWKRSLVSGSSLSLPLSVWPSYKGTQRVRRGASAQCLLLLHRGDVYSFPELLYETAGGRRGRRQERVCVSLSPFCRGRGQRERWWMTTRRSRVEPARISRSKQGCQGIQLLFHYTSQVYGLLFTTHVHTHTSFHACQNTHARDDSFRNLFSTYVPYTP